MSEPVKCLYHYPCHDGISAALVAYVYHRQKGVAAEMIPHTTFTQLDISSLNFTVSLHKLMNVCKMLKLQ